jgi:outer membrane protein TolC
LGHEDRRGNGVVGATPVFTLVGPPAPVKEEESIDMRDSGCLMLLVLLGLALPAPGSAMENDAPLLTLDEAIAIAVGQNARLALADAGVRIAEADEGIARSVRGLRVELSETFVRTTNPVLVFGNLLGQESFAAQNFELTALNTPDPLSNFNTTLAVTHPLYSGGRLSQGLAAAQSQHEAAALTRERTRQEVVRQVIAAYSDAVVAARQLEVARQTLETAHANERLVADLRQAGLAVESDLLQARVRVTEVEEMVASAESREEVARATVNLVLGRDLDTPFHLPSQLDAPGHAAEPLDALLAEAADRRPDLRAAHSRIVAAGQEARAARSTLLPEVGLTGLLEANAEDHPGADGDNWSVLVSASYTLFDGRVARARLRRADERRQETERMRDVLASSIGLEVRSAVADLTAARKRLVHADRAAEMAVESLRLVQDRYREGLTTLVELLEAETALSQARVRGIAARRDLLLSDAALELAVGRL